MDKSWRRWLMLVFLFMLSGVTLIATANILIDPYGVFGSSLMRPGVTVNDRYGKIRHLLARPGQYDGVLIGSSVMGVFDPRVAARLQPGNRAFYNLSFFGGTPSEALDNLTALEARGVRFSAVVMGIDAFTFLEGVEPIDLSRRPHPDISGEARPAFFLSYLLAPSFKALIGKIAHAHQAYPSLDFDFVETGRYQLPSYDHEFRAEPSAFTEKHVIQPGRERSLRAREGKIDPQKLEAFAQLAQWLSAHGVRSHFFINPMTFAMRAEVGEQNLTEIVRSVTGVIGKPVPDFSSSVEANYGAAAFYDLKHVRPDIAAAILTDVLR